MLKIVYIKFRNVSQHLIGVDLSPSIIEEAKKARPLLYDDTIAGDVMDAFAEKKPISLIIAADSYIYFGDLDPLFSSMAVGLEDGGFAAFTLENVSSENEASLDVSKPDWRWQLTASGRFAHRKEYVMNISRKYKMKPIFYQSMDGFRYENGVGVRGHIFVLQKQVSDEL
jgi:predicted TPR repeat methyltransferase